AQRANAADTQDHLLADAHVGVAAVELGGDAPVLGGVLWDVGIEQVERNAADLDAPDAGPDFAARERHTDQERRTVWLRFGDERQVEEVVFRIAFLLPAIDVEILAEVTLAVHQADAHEGNAEVAGGLEVVAGEHAEASRVDRHAFVDAELHGEVADAA